MIEPTEHEIAGKLTQSSQLDLAMLRARHILAGGAAKVGREPASADEWGRDFCSGDPPLSGVEKNENESGVEPKLSYR